MYFLHKWRAGNCPVFFNRKYIFTSFMVDVPAGHALVVGGGVDLIYPSGNESISYLTLWDKENHLLNNKALGCSQIMPPPKKKSTTYPILQKKMPRFGHQSHRNVWWSDVPHHTNASDQSPLTPRVVSNLPSSWDSQANDPGPEDSGISIESKIACHLRFHQNLQKVQNRTLHQNLTQTQT